MLHTIGREARLTAPLIGRSSFDPLVMEALKQVPRDAFVPPEMLGHAFDNGPLPIGQGQTISQPYIVALMTDLLDPQPTQTNGDDQSPSRSELIDQRLWQMGRGSGGNDAIVGGMLGPAGVAVKCIH
jgi:protein-L-isoaspartate O-methyltransferase